MLKYCKDCTNKGKDNGFCLICHAMNYACQGCGKIFSHSGNQNPLCSVFSIDGTLLYMPNKKERKNIKGDENVNTDVLIELDHLKTLGQKIIILTSRKRKKYKKIIKRWLKDYDISYDTLIMKKRDSGDKYTFKTKKLKKLQKKYNIYKVYDSDSILGNICQQLNITYRKIDSSGFLI